MGASTLLGSQTCVEELRNLISAVAPAQASSWAEILVEEFGGLRALLDAPAERVRSLTGCGAELPALFATARRLLAHVLRERLVGRPIISSSDALADYLKFTFGGLRTEQVRALYLDVKNFLIRDELVGEGTLNQAPIYPRRIVKRALELDAGGLILVHNHPSGDASPSVSDRDATTALIDAARGLDIILHDHVIVGRNSMTSFRALGYL
ncbi:MAG: repair protein RadC [Sphingomonas bacterium]|nr:DNA repair protein RadC [Sphingomonas bacterium]MDB5690793.1 repair protein RadC [Sphingomonas bacterium]